MRVFTLIMVALAALLVSVYIFLGRPLLSVLNGYAAKNLCSCVFVANIPEETARTVDLAFFPMNFADPEIDYEEKVVVSSFFGIEKVAVHREGLGCALVNSMDVAEVQSQVLDLTSLPFTDSLRNWYGTYDSTVYSEEILAEVGEILMAQFEEPDPEQPLNSRAVLVLHKGNLVGEAYGEGFNEHSKLLGWSMTKGITSTMAGVLNMQGKLQLEDQIPIENWSEGKKGNLNFSNLLHMSSGLKWTENYFGNTEVTQMLFSSDNMGLMASSVPVEKEPEEEWKYSSGTTNIISYALRSYFATDESYLKFPYETIFYKLGMYSMIMEPDASGTFVGSSYSWATARDWAKLGQLYLNRGKWGDEQIIPESWVDYVQTPAPASEGLYGGQFWLNKSKKYPDLPVDTYWYDGFHSQTVVIVPSKDLVFVRLGVTYLDNYDVNKAVAELIKALKL